MTVEDQLVAIGAESDSDRRWHLLSGLVRSDPSGARAAAEGALNADDSKLREAAADVLGQVATLDREAAIEIADTLVPRLAIEQDPNVLAALIVGLGHTDDPRVQRVVIPLAVHKDENIRLAVAFALPFEALDDESLAVLHRLSSDPDGDVRAWATFALANSDATDNATVEALAARADDPDEDARAEGIYGLARRKDPRARAFIERELARPEHGSLIERAAVELEA
jgi:HEAT repeat protein